MPPPEAFYIADPSAFGVFESTELTRGPWSTGLQHAGPPCALMAHVAERARPPSDPPMQIVRFTAELLRPIPIARLEVGVELLRPGKKVELTAVTLQAAGQTVARAHVLRMRVAPISFPPPARETLPVPGPAESAPFEFPFFDAPIGYHLAFDLRCARGSFGQGPVAMWFRMRGTLVAGAAPAPVERVLAAADSGNGISVVLDHRRYLFINSDLTVHLHRMPSTEWVCLDARTTPEPLGVGLADTRLYDERGPIGRGCQSLFIDYRTP